MPAVATTIRAIDDAGQDLRIWCFACARGSTVDAIIWRMFEARGWPADLPAATHRFTCRQCRSSADVLVVPATRPYRAPTSVTEAVAGYFHGMRSLAKARKRIG